MARTLTRIVAASEPAGRHLVAPVCKPSVRRVRPQLAGIAGRLSAAGPVDVQGVARLRLLVADGTGPLYQPARADDLRHELAAVVAALDSFD